MKKVEWLDLTEDEINNKGIEGREWADELTEEDDKYIAVECIYENADIALTHTDEMGADYTYEKDGEKRFIFVR